MATANELCCEWAGCGARLPSADLLCQHVEDDHIARCEGVRVGRVGIVTRTGNNSMYPKIYSSLEGAMKLRFAVPLEMCFIISSKDHKIIKMHIIIYIPYSGLISGVKSFVKSSNWPSEVIFVV